MTLTPVRVVLPTPLCTLARIGGEITVSVAEPVTLRTVVDAVEMQFPMLRGTIRDHESKKRRPFVRFFACRRDLSHQSIDEELLEPVRNGSEPLLIVGAMAGG